MKALAYVVNGGQRTGAECVFVIGGGEKTYEGVVARARELLGLPADVPLALCDAENSQPIANTSAWSAACGRAVRAAAARDPQRAFQDAVVRLSVELVPAAAAESPAQPAAAELPKEPEKREESETVVIDEDLRCVAEAAVAARSTNRVVQNSIAEITANPGSTALKAVKTAAKVLLPGAVKAVVGGVGAVAAAGAFLVHSQKRPFGVTASVAKPEKIRDMLVRLNLLSETDGAQGALDVLAGDPFQFVVGDEAALRATVDTTGLGMSYHLTYDEIADGAMYAFRTDATRVRACKRNERGSWQVGCATAADRAALAPLAPRIAQRTYFYAPQDAISTELLALTTATTASTAAQKGSGNKRNSSRKRRFAVRKCVYWLADVPHCAVRIAVLAVDRACLDARRDAALALVLAQMREMGFTDTARNRRALARHNGDLNAAVQDLL